jgi:DNA replication and repair protein RecF
VSGVALELLEIEGLRNIQTGELRLDGCCGLVTGGNGAGKTTVLEAAYLLARGRSFRGRRAGDLTTAGALRTRVRGRVAEGETRSEWLFERTGRVGARWIDAIPVTELADGGHRFSVRLVGENAQQLLEGDPALRRRFLDWNMFHMEPGYAPALRRYRQVLEQRNAWLRQGARGRSAWDDEFVSAGEALDALRQRGVARVGASLRLLSKHHSDLVGAELVYSSGISRGRNLQDALRADRETERTLGYTRIGPHRADFGIARDGKALALSRGQQKAVVCLIQLACAAVQESLQGTVSVWLLDDLWGDMDGDSASALVALFLTGGCQCLFTMIGAAVEVPPSLLPPDTRLFHMERGRIFTH